MFDLNYICLLNSCIAPLKTHKYYQLIQSFWKNISSLNEWALVQCHEYTPKHYCVFHFQEVNFIVCKLHLNKIVFKNKCFSISSGVGGFQRVEMAFLVIFSPTCILVFEQKVPLISSGQHTLKGHNPRARWEVEQPDMNQCPRRIPKHARRRFSH